MKGLGLTPHSSRDEGSSSSQRPVVCNAVIVHNSRRAQVDKRHMDIDDEIVMLQKQLLLVDKRSKLDKAVQKMKKDKQERKKDSDSDSSDSDSDERTKTEKNKKKVRSSRRLDSSSSPVPSTSARKSRDTSSRKPLRSSLRQSSSDSSSSDSSSSSSEDRKKRRRHSDKSLSRKKSPIQSPPTHRLKRSPAIHQAKPSPASHRSRRSPSGHVSKRSPSGHVSKRSPSGHVSKWSPATRARRSPDGDSLYSHSPSVRHRSYWSDGVSYYNQGRRGELSSYRPNPGMVFVDRSNAHRAPSVTVTEIHDEHDALLDEEHVVQPAKDSDELEEGEVDDDYNEPEAENNTTRSINSSVITIPDSPDKDRDRTADSKHRRTPERPNRRRRSSERKPENRRRENTYRPIKQERVTDNNRDNDMLKPKIERNSEIKEEQYKKRVKTPSRNPKFHLPVKKIIREMRFELKKIDDVELKDRLFDILWIIIRLRIKDVVKGTKHYMNFKRIVELYRSHFDGSEDGALVASVVGAVQDGAFKHFVPSDDEEQPKTEDFSEFFPYVPSKKKNDENKENEGTNEDVIMLESSVDVIDITEAEEDENQRLLNENAKKDASEAADLNRQIESVSIKSELTLCRVKKEKGLIGDIPEIIDLTHMEDLVTENDKSHPITHQHLNRSIKVEKATETARIKKEKHLTGDIPETSNENINVTNMEVVTDDISDNVEKPNRDIKVEHAKETVRIKTEKESEDINTKENEEMMMITDENSGHVKQGVAKTIRKSGH